MFFSQTLYILIHLWPLQSCLFLGNEQSHVKVQVEKGHSLVDNIWFQSRPLISGDMWPVSFANYVVQTQQKNISANPGTALWCVVFYTYLLLLHLLVNGSSVLVPILVAIAFQRQGIPNFALLRVSFLPYEGRLQLPVKDC